jgi:hypothetical protein
VYSHRCARQAERLEREKAEEEEFRRQKLERFAEQDRVEQLNAARRRIKVAEHLREVERLLAEKRALYAAARVRCPVCGSLLSSGVP